MNKDIDVLRLLQVRGFGNIVFPGSVDPHAFDIVKEKATQKFYFMLGYIVLKKISKIYMYKKNKIFSKLFDLIEGKSYKDVYQIKEFRAFCNTDFFEELMDSLLSAESLKRYIPKSFVYNVDNDVYNFCLSACVDKNLNSLDNNVLGVKNNYIVVNIESIDKLLNTVSDLRVNDTIKDVFFYVSDNHRLLYVYLLSDHGFMIDHHVISLYDLSNYINDFYTKLFLFINSYDVRRSKNIVLNAKTLDNQIMSNFFLGHYDKLQLSIDDNKIRIKLK